MSSLGFPRSKSLETPKFTSFPLRKSTAKTYNAPLSLDRYLTQEGHRLVISYLRCTQIQNVILQGRLHKLEENDMDYFINSYNNTSNNVLQTLNYQQLHLSAYEMKLLCKLIRADKITNIQTLNMTRNQLSGNSVKSLFEALQKNTTVKKLDLSFNMLGDREAKWLGKLLKKNKTLREVYLGSNRISRVGAKKLAKALRENNTVTRLGLELNRLNAEGGAIIAEMLKVNRSIKYLHLGSNNLQFVGVRAISDALKVNNALVSLSLDINSMHADGARVIGEALRFNQTLTHLYIPSNNIGDEGLSHLCTSLQENRHLIYLDLELNGIGARSNKNGAKALATLLERGRTPRAINLNYNPLGDEGCEALSAGFYKNFTLESIILSDCDIGLAGITAISEALTANHGLQNICLHRNNAIGADGHLVLADALEKNTSLKGVQLDYNFAAWERVANSIQSSLTRNHFLQQEKYAAARRILKAARVMLHSVRKGPPIVGSKGLSRSMSKTTSPVVKATTPLLQFTTLPYELREKILFALDSTNVLTDLQKIDILKFATRKETLGQSMEEFLSGIFHAYYPLISQVRLWPTEPLDNTAERF